MSCNNSVSPDGFLPAEPCTFKIQNKYLLINLVKGTGSFEFDLLAKLGNCDKLKRVVVWLFGVSLPLSLAHSKDLLSTTIPFK